MASRAVNFLLALASVAAALPAPASDIIPGKFIVTLQPEVGHDLELHTRWVSEVHAEGLRKRGGESAGVEKTFDLPGFHAYAGSFDEATLEVIKANSSVLRVEPDKIIRLASVVSQQSPPWGLSAISNPAPYAANAAYKYDSTAGAGTFSYIVDSGILLNHNEFAGGRAVAGFASGRATDRGHGTIVAGVVGGKTYGVAKGTTMIDVQALESESGDLSTILSGITWIVNDVKSKSRVGKSVVNMSLGGSDSPSFNAAVQVLIDTGITVVVAAGNSNQDAQNESPGNQENVITVAAVDQKYKRAYFSNFGKVVDIHAPGVGILTSRSSSVSASGTSDGTSEAAPFVAGFVAYLLGKEGSRTPAQVKTRVQELALKDVVTDTKGSPNLFLYNNGGI